MIARSSIRLVAAAGCALGLLLGCFSEHRLTDPQSAAAACALPDLPEVEGSTLVVIRNYAFHPASITVRPGARVTWVNCEGTGGLSHTTTADQGSWSSELVPPGATYTRTFDVAGTFDYHCEPHPFMKAAVIVE